MINWTREKIIKCWPNIVYHWINLFSSISLRLDYQVLKVSYHVISNKMVFYIDVPMDLATYFPFFQLLTEIFQQLLSSLLLSLFFAELIDCYGNENGKGKYKATYENLY